MNMSKILPAVVFSAASLVLSTSVLAEGPVTGLVNATGAVVTGVVNAGAHVVTGVANGTAYVLTGGHKTVHHYHHHRHQVKHVHQV